MRFAISGDADATPGPNGKPGFNRFETYGRMARRAQRLQHQPRRHDLLGLRGRRRAGRAHGRRRSGQKYRLGLALPALRRCGLARACTATGTTTSSSTTSRGRARRGDLPRRASRRSPTTHPSRTRRRRSVPHVPLGEEPRAVLPRRALVPQRQGDARHAAATSRRPRRRPCATAFAALAPSLAEPGRRPHASRRSTTRRGRCSAPRQYAAFTKAIRASTATFKVIVNEVPMQQLYALPYDRWEGYAAERERLLRVPAGT